MKINLKQLLKESSMIMEYRNQVGSTVVVIKNKSKGEAEIIFRELIARDMIKQLEGIKKITLEFK